MYGLKNLANSPIATVGNPRFGAELEIRTRAKIYAWLLLAAAISYVAWSSLTIYTPLVSSETGQASLKEVRDYSNELAERMQKTRAEHNLPFVGEQQLTIDHITGINHLAADAARARQRYFDHEHAYVWKRILEDIENYVQHLDGFGSSDPNEAEMRLQELNSALLQVLTNRDRAVKTMEGTKRIFSIHIGEAKGSLYTDILMTKTLLGAGVNEHLLLTTQSSAPPFEDIVRLQNAEWAVFELHQQLGRDYEQANRIPTAIRLLIGR